MFFGLISYTLLISSENIYYHKSPIKTPIFVIIVLQIFLSCVSEKEKRETEIRNESKKILPKALSKLIINEDIDHDSSEKIIAEFAKISHDSVELGLEYAMYWDSISKQLDATKPHKKTLQEDFIRQKTDLYSSGYINTDNEAAKMLFHKNTEELTTQLLVGTNQILTKWVGTISRISLAYGHNQRDMELLKTMSPNDVIEKYPEGRDINIYINVGEKKLDQSTYLAQVYQEYNPQRNERGIKPNSSLYETVLGLKEGQKVVFSAKVIRTIDTDGKNNEQYTGFNIEITDIQTTIHN